jgi:hypothetical protein
MPPGDGLHNTIVVNGRTYTCALGSVITVPDFDGVVMVHNGWVNSSKNGADSTANRPTKALYVGYEFHDLTLSKYIKWDGKVWRDAITGAAV